MEFSVAPEGEDERSAAALLREVAAIAAELHPQRQRSEPHLGSLLERELGLDSLGRVELLFRLQTTFGVSLPDRVAIDAQTPRDLWRAIVAAGPAGPRPPAGPRCEARSIPPGAPVDAARGAQTWIDVLLYQGERRPEAVHARFYSDAGDGEALTHGELLEGARRLAGGLRTRGVSSGETVALMLPSGRDYFFAFFGCLLVGAVPVPIYPPFRLAQIEDHLRRQAAILANAGAVALVATAELRTAAHVLAGRVESLRFVATPESLSSAQPIVALPRPSTTDTAVLQYTSGSTGTPRGVVLSHANLLANVRAVGVAVDARPDDVIVNWLPLYHDMGLTGSWLGSLYHGLPIVVLSPLEFLARPVRWLRAIHRWRGTITPAPNFAFELCVRRVDEGDLAELDLSSLRSVLNGAERVSPDTVERFLVRFAACGFPRAAMRPVYGLAESAAGLTFSPLGREPRFDAVHGDALAERGQASPVTAPGPQALRIASCGPPLAGHAVRIADAETGTRELPERCQGRVQFRGPSATTGYFRNPEATADLFRDGWLETGDLGYLAAGELHVTGRLKDLIIRAGRNLHPEEIEAAVGRVAGVRTGSVVAFGVPDPRDGTERLVVIAETRASDPAGRRELERAVLEAMAGLALLPPDLVLLVPPNTLPKTSSGKLRRSACRRLYEEGSLGRRSRPLWVDLLLLRLEAAWARLRRP